MLVYYMYHTIHLLFLYVPIKKNTSITLCFFSILFLVIRRYYALDLFFCVDCTIMAIPYFLLGHYLGKKGLIELLNDRKINLFLAIISGIIVYLILIINGAAQMNVLSYGDNVILNYLAGIIGSLMVFMIAKLLTEIWHEKEWIKIITVR